MDAGNPLYRWNGRPTAGAKRDRTCCVSFLCPRCYMDAITRSSDEAPATSLPSAASAAPPRQQQQQQRRRC